MDIIHNKINYQAILDEIIAQIPKEKVPSLLLHSCCAPCSSYVLEYLSQYFKITVLYYNPNITSPNEYEKRLIEQERFINSIKFKNPVTFAAGTYEPEVFFEMAKRLENEPEQGARCLKCYEMRLLKSAQYAKENNFDYFTTTLTISPMKNSQVINEIGKKISEKIGVPYLFSDFKKKNGYKRSIELSAQFGLYRQNYCGCIFSRQENSKKNVDNLF